MSWTNHQCLAPRQAPEGNSLPTNPVKLLVISLGVAASLITDSAAHSPLLPRPQQVQYENGTLPLRGLSIRFAAPTTTEDRFAAEQLASRLSAIGQTHIPIRKGKGSGRAIVLNRTAAGGALPGDNESTGPDSREAYSVQITPKGAEIRAASSAGLFYGVQTLVQMVEGAGPQAVLPTATVRDWPALAYRGFMMDLSHGQLLRVSEIERQLDLLARFKANQYYFYSEASIEFEGYEVVNPDGPLHARRSPAHHRIRAPAPHRRSALHGALRPHARPFPRREVHRPWPAPLRR